MTAYLIGAAIFPPKENAKIGEVQGVEEEEKERSFVSCKPGTQIYFYLAFIVS